MTAEHEERLEEVKWWREEDEASAALAKHAVESAERREQIQAETRDRIEALSRRPHPAFPGRIKADFEPERPTREQVEDLQRQAARQVYDEWVAAGRPGEHVAVQWRAHGINDWRWVTENDSTVKKYRRAKAEADWAGAGVEHRIVPWMDVPEADRLRGRKLTVRFELAPGFGLSWLSLLACCCELRGGIVDAKGCGLDDG